MSLGPENYTDALDEIKSSVSSKFTVSDVYYTGGVLTFRVEDAEIKQKFKELYRKLRDLGYVPTAERDGQHVLIKIYPFKPVKVGSLKVPFILLAATLGTIFVDGYIRFAGLVEYARSFGIVTYDLLTSAMLFTLSVIAIIGIHELGHKIAAKINGIDTTLPYFIPGVPGQLPTFGAVIFQRGPVVNRDELFDLGISGPIAGFLVSILVLALAFTTSVRIPYEEAARLFEEMLSEGAIPLPRPLIFYLFDVTFSSNGVPLLTFTPFSFPAWLGMLITGLNLLPIWQLDGGRVFRGLVSRRTHVVLSYVSIVFLLISGYYLLAILLLFLMRGSVDIAPLDNVSPLSNSRKVLFAFAIIILILTYVFFPNPLINL